MNKFARIIDKIITFIMVLVDIVSAFIYGSFALVAMFADIMYSSTWNSLWASLIGVIAFNGIIIMAKIGLRTFKGKQK